ncbi:MAG: DUF2125 domain-containing protein [Pseudomonadota bacterium]
MSRWLTILIIVAVAGYSGYWWVGSTAQERGLKAWVDDRRSDGWVADYADLSVQGYPNRFDTKVTELTLADPRSNWAWSAPAFQINMLSYKPNHIIAVWPQRQKVSSPTETMDVMSEDMRASVKFEADTALALSAATMDMKAVEISSSEGWTTAMAAAKFATRQTAGVNFSHDVYFKADQMRPARVLKAFVDPDGRLPEVFDEVLVDAVVGFDSPWDRHAIEGRKPEVTRLELKNVLARWGELEFQAKGVVDVDRAGVPTGEIAVRAQNWRDMLAVGVSAGLIREEIAGTLERGLSLLAGLSGNPETIDAPLGFKNGFITLGPIPVGRAPVIRINP